MGNMTHVTYSLQHIFLLKLLALFPLTKDGQFTTSFFGPGKSTWPITCGCSYDFIRVLWCSQLSNTGLSQRFMERELLPSVPFRQGGFDLYCRTAPAAPEYFPEHCVKTALQYKTIV